MFNYIDVASAFQVVLRLNLYELQVHANKTIWATNITLKMHLKK